MNKMIRNALRALVLSVAAGSALPAAADVITLRADEWCPYNCTPGSDKPGFMIEVAQKVFEKAGHQVDYQTLNWARAIDDSRQGKFVGIVGAARGDAEDFVFPDENLGLSANAFAVRKDDPWKYNGVESLANRTLGVIRDYSYGDAVDAYVEKYAQDEKRIQVASGDNALELNLRKLQRSRIDTLVEGDYVLRYTLANLQLDKEIRVAGSADPDPVFIAFSPANPKSKEYAALLTEGIRKLRASGELKAILSRYGVTDWK